MENLAISVSVIMPCQDCQKRTSHKVITLDGGKNSLGYDLGHGPGVLCNCGQSYPLRSEQVKSVITKLARIMNTMSRWTEDNL